MSDSRKQRRKNVTSLDLENLIKALLTEFETESKKEFNSGADLQESKRRISDSTKAVRKSIKEVRKTMILDVFDSISDTENEDSDLESEYGSDDGYDTAPDDDPATEHEPKSGAEVQIENYRKKLQAYQQKLRNLLTVLAASPPVKFIHAASENLVSMLKL